MPLTFKDFMALFLSPKGPLSLFALLCSRLISLPTVPSQSKACPVMEIDWLLLKIHVAQVVLDPFWTSQGPFLLLNSWTGQNHFHFHLLLLKLTCLVLGVSFGSFAFSFWFPLPPMQTLVPFVHPCSGFGIQGDNLNFTETVFHLLCPPKTLPHGLYSLIFK